MMSSEPFEIFLAAPPGLEPVLADEARERGFAGVAVTPGGVTIRGGWPEVWRANLDLRGAGRVLARIGAFRAMHLAQLDKRARKFPWGTVLRPDVPLRVEATCRKSRIYHAGAAAQRVERAIAESLGAPAAQEGDDAIRLLVRIEDDLCSFSIDTSGAPLHRRGHKTEVNKAPLRETLAALFLRACGFDGAQPVLDPMCGSGTFVIEAAEIAAQLAPGRSRRFAFEFLATFDAEAWAAMRSRSSAAVPAVGFHGSDRDAGAVRMSRANADRAGVGDICHFREAAISDVVPPEGPPGLVMVNPPYGGRIGNRKLLYGLYGALGRTLSERFGGWTLGLVTGDPALARATGLRLTEASPPVPHGGLKIRLYRSDL